MSCKELIESLRKGADERVRALWQDAESEAAKIREDIIRRLAQLREDISRKETILVRDRIAQALSDADNRARIFKLSAEQDLSDRLFAVARSNLRLLRNAAYEALFADLARELPALSWQLVQVHPDDVVLAKKYFPGAEIVADPRITGGMDASARDGTIRVINTFEKRLDRAWSALQPLLIREAYKEVENGTPSAPGRPGVSGGVSPVEDQRQAVEADLGVETPGL